MMRVYLSEFVLNLNLTFLQYVTLLYPYCYRWICCAVISNSSSTVSVPISNTDLVITLPVNILADTLLTMKGYVFHSETYFSSCWRMFCLWLHQKLSKYIALNLNGRLGYIAKENPIKCNNRKYTSQRFETWRDITIFWILERSLGDKNSLLRLTQKPCKIWVRGFCI